MGRKARIIGLIAVAALAAALAILWPVVGSASPKVAAASSTYTDASGDATNGGPDITTVVVSEDSSGKITFTVTIGNRPALTDVDAIQAFFDTDKNAGTGSSGGYDYEVAWIDGHQELDKWDGSQFATQQAASFKASYSGGQATFSVDKADLGGSTAFNFVVSTTGDGGDSTSDRTPDGTANWTFPSTGGTSPPPPPPPPGSPPPPGAPPPPPANGLTATKLVVGKAHAGKPLTVSFVARVNGTAVKTTVACTARIGTKKVAVKSKGSVLSGRAACTWTVPKGTKGKTVKGTIAATYQGTTVKKSFSARVLS